MRALGLLLGGLLAAHAACAADELPRRGVLGLMLPPGPPDAAAVVHAVAPGSAAERAGLAPGQRLKSLNGIATGSVAAFLEVAATLKAGADVPVEVEHAGTTRRLHVQPMPAPPEQGEAYRVEYGVVQGQGHRLRSLLTLPKQGKGPYPALMIVQGLGCFSVDNEPAQQPMYRPLIEALSRQGFATFRVDKPGTGDSEGGPCSEVDYETELAGYRAGLDALLEERRIAPDQVFVLGHSMGGIMMPSLIAGRNVAGAIVYGTGFKSFMHYHLDSIRRQLELEGQPLPMIEAKARETELLASHLYVLDWTLAQVREKFPQFAAEYPQGEALFSGKPVRYFQQIQRHQLPAEWAKLDTRVLALYGASDFVSFEDDHRGVAAAVNRVTPGRAEFRVVPEADHWFRRAKDFAESRRQGPAGPYNDAVVSLIVDWVTAVAG